MKTFDGVQLVPKIIGKIILLAVLIFASGGWKTEGAPQRRARFARPAAGQAEVKGKKIKVIVQEFSGQVMVREESKDSWEKVFKGMSIPLGNEIRTEQGSVKISFGAEKSIKVLEDSYIKLGKNRVELLQGFLRASWKSKGKESFYVLAKNVKAELISGTFESWIKPEDKSVALGAVKGNVKVLVSLEGKVYQLALKENTMIVVPEGKLPAEAIVYTPSTEPATKFSPRGRTAALPTLLPTGISAGFAEQRNDPEPIEASSFQP